MEAYDTFAAAADTNALKVVLEGGHVPLPRKEREAVVTA